MGFSIMILSLILGLVFTFSGVSRRKQSPLYIVSIVIGVILIAFAIYLAFPK